MASQSVKVDHSAPACASLPLFARIRRTLYHIPMSTRKDLMTILRIGASYRRNPRVNNRLRRRITEQSFIIKSNTQQQRTYSGHQLLDLIDPMLSTPVKRSLLSLLLRCVPLEDRSEFRQIIQDSVVAEVTASQSTIQTGSLQYPMLSSYEHCLEYQIHDKIPLRQYLAVDQLNKLHGWKYRLSKKFILPKCSTKTIGRESTISLRRTFVSEATIKESEQRNLTTADLERYYAETGLTVEGPCEVRVAWMYAQIKPRTYYATGASAFNAAKYVHLIFDSLQRTFRCTNPSTRYSTSRFPVCDFEDGEMVMIYDYAAFTSSLKELPAFIDALAVFCGDTTMRIWDSYSGEKIVTIKSVLMEYNRVCNAGGLFDVAPAVKVFSDDKSGTPILLRHHVAGMLGVYGNISSSTSLHGLVGSTIVGSEDRINAIGDDAVGIFDIKHLTIEENQDAVTTIGSIPKDKFETFTKNQEDVENDLDQSWHYTKRPINVTSGFIKIGWMPDFPVYPVLYGIIDGMHSNLSKTFVERRRTAITQSIRLIQSVHEHIDQCTEEDIEHCLDILKSIYRRMNLPFAGSLPSWNDEKKLEQSECIRPDSILCSPVLTADSFYRGYKTVLMESCCLMGNTISMPQEYRGNPVPLDIVPGQRFEGSGDRYLSYLGKLGYFDKRALYEELEVSDRNLQRLFDFVEGRRIPVYCYTVIEKYHLWDELFVLMNDKSYCPYVEIFDGEQDVIDFESL